VSALVYSTQIVIRARAMGIDLAFSVIDTANVFIRAKTFAVNTAVVWVNT
jgi:hypothetical protein